MNVNFEIESRSLNILTKEVVFLGIGDGFFKNYGSLWKFFPNVDVGDVSSNSIGRDYHALDELVRILMDNVAVLECAWFRLVTVTNQVDWLGIIGRDKSPFDSSWKACTSASTKTRSFNFIDDSLRLHL